MGVGRMAAPASSWCVFCFPWSALSPIVNALKPDESSCPASRPDGAGDPWQQVLEEMVLGGCAVTRSQRVELLHRLLGDDVCRQLGVYRLPAGFLLSVVIPVYNEARTIEHILERVRATELPVEIILVDDGSTDGTREVLQRVAGDDDCRVILHERNQGKGAAVRSGLAAAQGDVVVIQDADLEYDPRDLRLLLQPIVENEADVVFGSRFIHNDRPVSPLWHQGANQLITFCAVVVSGYRFTDVETCYKMFRRELLERMVSTLREKRFGIEIELTFKLVRQSGVRFFERPIRYARRSYAEGKKIGWRDGCAALWCILRYGLFHRHRKLDGGDTIV
jgi:glycosyltransferase involved in cell wall biosynthesis